MLHEAKDRQKFVSDAQYLRDMQHKVDSEYQESGRRCSSLLSFEACLRRQEQRRDSTDKKLWVTETNLERSRFSSGSSSKQSSVEEDPLAEPRLSAKTSVAKCDSKLPAIDQTSVKQKHKSTMTPRKPEKLGPSKPSPGADLGAVKTCEMCKQSLMVDLDDLNLSEFYQKHQQSQAQNQLMNSGLYLVLLLHLYEQRFAELMRLNYNRVTRERLSRNYPQPRPEENERTPGRSWSLAGTPRIVAWTDRASAAGKEAGELFKRLLCLGPSHGH
ncbi:putative E3 ubiquitin-protein ligase MARCHF10 isoform X14 [Tamandua tetradactyla]|uniref:putative E3 ubiquitin-protein ligase MARCHF10 isoform X14 n=1 Tax=Tamandua tetradactyla TaxID=48850 RepID=UPI004053A020